MLQVNEAAHTLLDLALSALQGSWPWLKVNCAHCLAAVPQHRSGPILSAGPSLRQPLCRIVSNNIVFWRLMSLRVKPSERAWIQS